MCVVSMIGDEFSRDWTKRFPDFVPTSPLPHKPSTFPEGFTIPVSRKEFDELKREVELLKRLLKAAQEYDARNNEPHCETDEKTRLLREIAKAVGVDLSDIFPNHPGPE